MSMTIESENDIDFMNSLKKILGIDSQQATDLLLKLSVEQVIDLADAVTNHQEDDVREIAGRTGVALDANSDDQSDSSKNEENDSHDSEENVDADEEQVFSVGEKVRVNGKVGSVKIPHGPSNTVGIVIGGKLKIVDRGDVNRLHEKVLGMSMLPGLRRMQELAGIMVEEPFQPVHTDADTQAKEVSSQHQPTEHSQQVPQEHPEEETADPVAQATDALDQLERALPDIRLADLKAIRQRFSLITNTMNESFSAGRKPRLGRPFKRD